MVHICCDLYISFYDYLKQEVGAFSTQHTEACLSE